MHAPLLGFLLHSVVSKVHGAILLHPPSSSECTFHAPTSCCHKPCLGPTRLSLFLSKWLSIRLHFLQVLLAANVMIQDNTFAFEQDQILNKMPLPLCETLSWLTFQK